MIVTSSQWKSLSPRPGKLILAARLYYGAEGASDYIPVATDDITIGSERFLGVVKQTPNVITAVDMREHTHSIGSLKLEIDNLEYQPGKRFSDFLEELGSGSDIGFENRKADLRLWLPGITSWANCFPLLTRGKIAEGPHGRQSLGFEIEDWTELVHIDLFDPVETSDSADALALPQESLGKDKPSVYGDHRNYKADDSKSLDTAVLENNMTPLVYLGIDSSGNHRWLASNHEMNEIGVASEQEQIWGWDDVLKRYVRLTSITVEQNTSAGCIISHANDPQFIDYVYGKGVPTTSQSGTITGFANTARIVDKAFDVSSDGSIDPNASINDYIRVNIVFPDWDYQSIDDADIIEVALLWYANLDYAGATDDTYIELKTPSVALTTPEEVPTVRIKDAIFTATKAGITSDAYIIMNALKNFAGADQVTIHIFEVYKSIEYKPGKLLNLFFAGKGREYEAWIADRDIAVGGFSEDHADNNQDNQLIENPAGIIESLLRDKLSQGNDEIDRDTFNIASNDYGNIVLSPETTERKKSLELLTSFCAQSRSFIWWQPDGTYKIKVLEDTYAGSDRVIDYNDIKDLEFDRTPVREIATAVIVEYSYDYGSGKYMKRTALSEDSTQQTKYNVSQAQSKLIYQARYIIDDDAAIALRNFKLAMWKQPHNIAIGTLGKEYLDLDIGDIIEFSNMPYKVRGEDITGNVTRAGQTIYKYWWLFHVDRGSTMKFNAIQLHDLS